MTATDNASRHLLPRRLQVRSYRALSMAAAAVLIICILVLTGSLSFGKGVLALALIGLAGLAGGMIAKRLSKPVGISESGAARSNVDMANVPSAIRKVLRIIRSLQ